MLAATVPDSSSRRSDTQMAAARAEATRLEAENLKLREALASGAGLHPVADVQACMRSFAAACRANSTRCCSAAFPPQGATFRASDQHHLLLDICVPAAGTGLSKLPEVRTPVSELLAASKKRTDSLVSHQQDVLGTHLLRKRHSFVLASRQCTRHLRDQGRALRFDTGIDVVKLGCDSTVHVRPRQLSTCRTLPCLQKSASARSDTSLLESKRRALERKLDAKQRGVSSAHFVSSLRLLLPLL